MRPSCRPRLPRNSLPGWIRTTWPRFVVSAPSIGEEIAPPAGVEPAPQPSEGCYHPLARASVRLLRVELRAAGLEDPLWSIQTDARTGAPKAPQKLHPHMAGELESQEGIEPSSIGLQPMFLSRWPGHGAGEGSRAPNIFLGKEAPKLFGHPHTTATPSLFSSHSLLTSSYGMRGSGSRGLGTFSQSRGPLERDDHRPSSPCGTYRREPDTSRARLRGVPLTSSKPCGRPWRRGRCDRPRAPLSSRTSRTGRLLRATHPSAPSATSFETPVVSQGPCRP